MITSPALRRSLLGICTAAALLARAQADFTVDLGRGPVTIFTPAGHDQAQPTPLLLSLHGYGSSGASHESYTRFLSVIDTYGFMYAHPDGTTDIFGFQFWNATDACCNFTGSNVDDSSYLRALIDTVKGLVAVDDRRVYVMGHSNGGFMSYRMACDHADSVAAIVSLAGATFDNPLDCTPSGPLQVLQIHGTSDNLVLYAGGDIAGVPYPGAVESVEIWATYDGCSLVPDTSSPNINIDKSIPGDETMVTRYETGCVAGGSAELWTIVGGAHSPALVKKFPALVVEWLYAHPKPGIDVQRYCTPAVPNSTGFPGSIDATGSDAIAHNDVTLTASTLPLNQFGFFLVSQDQGFVANPGGSAGNLCLGNNIGRMVDQIGNSGASGSFSATIDLTVLPMNPPQEVLTGETWHFQTWYRDGGTSNFTDGISILFR